MGMPITIDIRDSQTSNTLIEKTFAYFRDIDERFSTYKETSEISRINRGDIDKSQWSSDMQEVFALAQKTKMESSGYFDIKRPDGLLDPSGIVKGWAILHAANELIADNCNNFYIEAGGDIASHGKNSDDKEWSVGIRNPFKENDIVKVIYPKGLGVATSGSYERGTHIYDPHDPTRVLDTIVSITVIGPDVLEADRFATAAFAMGRNGIQYIERLQGFEAYMIDRTGTATMTSGFEAFTTIV